ncbi:MAG: polyphosphate kinase 1 [Pseudomonadales bacterium]
MESWRRRGRFGRWSKSQQVRHLTMDAPALSNPELFINRELSMLEFDRRVLAQALDERVPLLERLRFLCIASSNLDEFFEIRVSGLKQQAVYAPTQCGPDGLTPQEQITRINAEGRAFVEEQYRILGEVLLPALDHEGIRLLGPAQWTARQRQWLKRFFHRELAPILNPIALDPAHPFPQPMNKNLAFIVDIEGEDAFGRQISKAIVQAPRSLPRLVAVPDSLSVGGHEFVLLTSIIEGFIADLFPGVVIVGCYPFRVTRNSDLMVDEDEVDDLLRAVQGELSSRRFGDAVRLELAGDCPQDLEQFLTNQCRLGPDEVYRCRGPVNLVRLSALPDLVDRSDLKYRSFKPGLPERLHPDESMFDIIRRGDLLLHHPFQSFAPVLDFLREAAADPAVVAIRQTLYRTGTDSQVVEALTRAAANGKEVLVVIELRARFDEEANISLANHLQKVGAQVVYGVVGHKTHAKMSLVVRREGRILKRYVHLGTGNYHAGTARAYTDYGLFTCRHTLALDVQRLFQQLTSLGRNANLRTILQSPFTLHRSMLAFIEGEIRAARAGRPARVVAKMNALVEPEVIQALYRASQAGVTVELIVRGVCALRPGIVGISDNIRVRSIVGRFLEHTRVFWFHNTDPQIYLSSADWMGRNFFSRVETCFPILDQVLARRIQHELELYLADNTQAWMLEADGRYRQVAAPIGAAAVSAQAVLLTNFAGG